jgi:DnaJ-class molecular chaperone
MTDVEYWEETIDAIFDKHKICASVELIAAVAKDVCGAASVFGESTTGNTGVGSDVTEVNRLKILLEEEKSKIMCPICGGTGREILSGLVPANSQCSRCNGTGRV